MIQKLFSKGKASMMVMSAPDQNIFKRPMSHGAREALSALLDWANNQTKPFGFNARTLMTEFVKQYDQLKFEEAEQSYHLDEYVKAVVGVPGSTTRKGLKPKTPEDVISILTLDKLFNGQWAHDNGITKRNRVADIKHAGDTYNWLMDNFVLGDFSAGDLSKIAEMGRSFSFDMIRREAIQIADPDKRTIPYLYAVVRGVSSRDEMLNYRAKLADKDNVKKLAALGELAIEADNKVARKFDEGKRAQWEREREYADILKKLDDM